MKKNNNSLAYRKRALSLTVSLFKMLFIIGICYLFLFPILNVIITAFRPIETAQDPTAVWIPRGFSLEGIKGATEQIHYKESATLSLLIVVGSTLGALISCSLAGYGLARFKFVGNNLTLCLVILTIIIPPQVMYSSTYLMYRFFDFGGILSVFGLSINLLETPWVFILPSFFASGLRNGIFIFIFYSMFKGLPVEMEEAAKIDGCGVFKTFIKVMAPLAVPSFVTVLLFSVIWHWTDFQSSVIYFTQEIKPIVVAKYVRIEILEVQNPYYNDKIISVISELSVMGLGMSETYRAVSALKTKWAELSYPEASAFYPAAYHSGGWGIFEHTAFDSLSAPYEATYGMLGDKYTEFDLNVKGDGADVILGYYVDTYRTNAEFTVSGYSDMYFYIYVKSVTAAGTLTPTFYSNDFEKTLACNAISIDESSVGKWIKVSAADLIGGGIDTFISTYSTGSRLGHIRFAVSSGADADVIMGSLMFEKNISLPEASDTWSNGEWLAAAEELDISGYSNTESFIEAIDVVKSYIGEDDADYIACVLKRNWKSMTGPVSSAFYPVAYYYGEWGIFEHTDFDSSSAPYEATYGMLGDKYTEFNLNVKGDGTTSLLGYYIDTDRSNAEFTISGCSDMYFYMYVKSVTTAGTLTPTFYSNDYQKTLACNAISIDESSVGKWIKVSAADLIDGGIDTFISTYSTGSRLGHIRFAVSSGADADVIMGSLIFEQNIPLSDELASVSKVELLLTALELDISEYENTEGFVEKLALLKSILIPEGKYDVIDLVRLKKYVAGVEIEPTSTVGDLNEDNKIETSDIVLLRKILLCN